MKTRKYAKLANAAADWWANAVKNPRFDNGTKEQGGTPLAGMLALMGNQPQSDETLGAFKEKLAKRIEKELTTGRYDRFGLSIGVDYHPDQLLTETAAEAGMHGGGMSTFPWKTKMWVEPGTNTVKVSAGYGAAIQQVYPST